MIIIKSDMSTQRSVRRFNWKKDIHQTTQESVKASTISHKNLLLVFPPRSCRDTDVHSWMYLNINPKPLFVQNAANYAESSWTWLKLHRSPLNPFELLESTAAFLSYFYRIIVIDIFNKNVVINGGAKDRALGNSRAEGEEPSLFEWNQQMLSSWGRCDKRLNKSSD